MRRIKVHFFPVKFAKRFRPFGQSCRVPSWCYFKCTCLRRSLQEVLQFAITDWVYTSSFKDSSTRGAASAISFGQLKLSGPGLSESPFPGICIKVSPRLGTFEGLCMKTYPIRLSCCGTFHSNLDIGLDSPRPRPNLFEQSLRSSRKRL